MKKLLRSIKYLFTSRNKVVKRVELTTGLVCVHTLDRVKQIISIDVQKVYS